MNDGNTAGCGDGHVTTMTVYCVEEHHLETKGCAPSPEHAETINLLCTPGQIVVIQEKEAEEMGCDDGTSPCPEEREPVVLVGVEGQHPEERSDENDQGGDEIHVTELRVYVPEGDRVMIGGEGGASHGTEDPVHAEEPQSVEMVNQSSNGGDQTQGDETLVGTPDGDPTTVVSESGTSSYTADPTPDVRSGSSALFQHEPVAGGLDSSNKIVRRHIMSSYYLEYFWSPLLKYCTMEEFGIQPICLCWS